MTGPRAAWRRRVRRRRDRQADLVLALLSARPQGRTLADMKRTAGRGISSAHLWNVLFALKGAGWVISEARRTAGAPRPLQHWFLTGRGQLGAVDGRRPW